MFNETAPSLSDIAAVTNNRNNGFDNGNGWWVLIILFALFGGWGRNGQFGSTSWSGTPATNAEVQAGFNNQGVTNKLNGLENGICSLGYDQLNQMNGLQNAIQQAQFAQMQSANNIQSQLANCCCENRQAVTQVRYDMATDTCAITNAVNSAARDITENQNANYRALHDEIVANRMEDKNARIAELQSQVQALNLAQSQSNQNQYLINQLRPCPVPAYQVPSPCASVYGMNTCGCGC